MSRVAWIDATAGVAGDMLLGALRDLGLLDDLPDVVRALPVDADVRIEEVRRAGQRAVAVAVTAAEAQPHRRLADLLALVAGSGLDAAVRQRATAVFRRLAAAEADVHGVAVEDVHFHEVGAVDALVDVLGGCLGLHRLAADRLVVSAIALGSGRARTAHGDLPVPVPAVVRLLADSVLTAGAGPADFESATPTGVGLLAEWAAAGGAMPGMTVERVGLGAGGREVPGRPNVVRVVTGSSADVGLAESDWLVVEANVDDLDPRLWPTALDALLAAGAADAWLTPILMKKGRPAHTLHALTESGRLAAVTEALFTHTSTIGFRVHPVTKHALDRHTCTVEVLGHQVRVKVSRGHDARALTATPEWEDVRATATALGLPPRQVLALAQVAATSLLTH